jgi:hypothetical protein
MESLPSYLVPQCRITFDPAARVYGFEVRFAGQAPHYHMQVFESLERTRMRRLPRFPPTEDTAEPALASGGDLPP